MARPVTLFTGQYADLPLELLAEKAASWGYDGLELACWGDHFEVDLAMEKEGYVQTRRDILEKNGLKYFALSTHLVGQGGQLASVERLIVHPGQQDVFERDLSAGDVEVCAARVD